MIGQDPNINQREIPSEVYCLEEDGTFKELIKPNVRLENTHYWQQQSRKIGVVILLSGLLFFAVLLNESNIANMIWTTVWGFLTSLIPA